MHMKAYFAHLMNGVTKRYTNSFASDPDLRLSVKLSNYLFLTVRFNSIHFFCYVYDYGNSFYNNKSQQLAGLVLKRMV